ncbi:hypothetical protein [Streptomyces sp. NPDC048825]|uniref:hypothetical protein n=1 Tax=Streptomyces sp. NPDC048825 TaxID=3365592 RepID=UPI003716A677
MEVVGFTIAEFILRQMMHQQMIKEVRAALPFGQERPITQAAVVKIGIIGAGWWQSALDE